MEAYWDVVIISWCVMPAPAFLLLSSFHHPLLSLWYSLHCNRTPNPHSRPSHSIPGMVCRDCHLDRVLFRARLPFVATWCRIVFSHGSDLLPPTRALFFWRFCTCTTPGVPPCRGSFPRAELHGGSPSGRGIQPIIVENVFVQRVPVGS